MAFTLHCFADIPTSDWLALLNHPDVIRHMPLADGSWTEASARDWAKGKDAQWHQNGYGPWSIRIDDRFAGWGGFQNEADGADLALVLLPQFWGARRRAISWLHGPSDRAWHRQCQHPAAAEQVASEGPCPTWIRCRR
ncbi:GNAT family N-acetyltransferase [Bosea sp. 2KB_26]|uniref:GNAT family N-acetyltransferase n=1 Tax=Bosea sp. 2KB_26 TaxID=3237475 RepID=UPI003F933C97